MKSLFECLNISTPSNTLGMGNMLMPTDTKPGSGDIPQGISIPIKQISSKYKKKNKKHKMKDLRSYIQEGFKLGKNKVKKTTYNFYPKSKQELVEIIKDKVKNDNFDFNDIDVSNINDMAYLFFGLDSNTRSKITKLDLTNWNVENIENMTLMFSTLYNLEELNIDGWITSSVKTFDGIFEYCEKLVNIIGIENLNTQKATSLESMFKNCESLQKLDLSKWNVSNCRISISMFEDCHSLETIGDTSQWNLKNLKKCDFMFYNCEKLKNIQGIENWNISQLNKIKQMFDNCDKSIIPSWYK